MDLSSFSLGALVGTIPAAIGSVAMVILKRQIDGSLERLKRDFQEDVFKFTKWHEKRITALEAIYKAFSEYLDFLRRTLYFAGGNRDVTPMHDFSRTLQQQMLYLDDSMAKQISQYQGELLTFWNWAITSLATEGEGVREKIQHKLDFEVPAYMHKLQVDINRYLDPNHRASDDSYRKLIIHFLEASKTPTVTQHTPTAIPK